MRSAAAGSSSNTDEIVRVAPPTRNVYAPLPAGTNVNITDSMMRNAESDENDWLLHGRTYDNQRYSPLRQISAANVSSLTPVALVQTGMTASFEATPIVVNGVMYLTTPVVDHKMKILAVNAATGERLWDVTYNLGAFQICCGPVNRGVAVGYGNVYVVTLDDHLLALDAADGHTVWDTTIVGSQDGYSETLAPQIYDGMVIVGSAGGEWALRGFVAAYDAVNGQQRWRWMSTDPKTYAGQLLAKRRGHGVDNARDRPHARDSSFSAPATRTPTSTGRSGKGTICTPTASSRWTCIAAISSGTTRRSSTTCGTTMP